MSARHDPVIRLHHTGRTIMARCKYDANLQNLARCVGSTCHDGLLASAVWGMDWRTPREAGPPETHPHTRDVVVYAECSSRTLAPGLQLCKECTDPTLRRPLLTRRHVAFLLLRWRFPPPLDRADDPLVLRVLLHRPPQESMVDVVEGFDNLLPLSTTHSLTPPRS